MPPAEWGKAAVEWVMNVGVVVLMGIVLVSALGGFAIRTLKRLINEWYDGE